MDPMDARIKKNVSVIVRNLARATVIAMSKVMPILASHWPGNAIVSCSCNTLSKFSNKCERNFWPSQMSASNWMYKFNKDALVCSTYLCLRNIAPCLMQHKVVFHCNFKIRSGNLECPIFKREFPLLVRLDTHRCPLAISQNGHEIWSQSSDGSRPAFHRLAIMH